MNLRFVLIYKVCKYSPSTRQFSLLDKQSEKFEEKRETRVNVAATERSGLLSGLAVCSRTCWNIDNKSSVLVQCNVQSLPVQNSSSGIVL